MICRSILLAALFGLAAPFSAGANPPVGIRSLWALDPAPNGNGLNQVKGVLHYRINGETVDRTLISYGNGLDGQSLLHQCVELIKRYAASLGISTNSGFGDGQYVAQNFATRSSGAFSFVPNDAPNLPKPGAVLSVSGWDALPEGHVGIIANHSDAEAASGMVKIKLFDQNMPVDSWKEITFRNVGGRWRGTMLNKGVERLVVGWANPSG